jgi:hypothetical protein
MDKIFFFFVAVMLLCSRLVSAQVLETSQGKVEVIQDEKITQLSEQYSSMSRNNPEVDGYRVQIFFDSGSNSKNKAASLKAEFDLAYPLIKSYLSYKEPYYRVRVGDFRSLVEAVGFQQKINIDYPNSFPVKDKIVQ